MSYFAAYSKYDFGAPFLRRSYLTAASVNLNAGYSGENEIEP